MIRTGATSSYKSILMPDAKKGSKGVDSTSQGGPVLILLVIGGKSHIRSSRRCFKTRQTPEPCFVSDYS
jgi:hypothetical protein